MGNESADRSSGRSADPSGGRTRTEAVDITTPSITLPSLRERRISRRAIRVSLALVGAVIGLFGWTSVRLNGGDFEYAGSFDFGWTKQALFAAAVVVAAAFLKPTRIVPWIRGILCGGCCLWAAWGAFGSMSEWVTYLAITGGLLYLWPRFAWPIRRQMERLWRSVRQPVMAAVPLIAIALSMLVTFGATAPPAAAQGEAPRACTNDDADLALTVNGDEDLPVAFDGSTIGPIDLRDGVEEVRFLASHTADRDRVVSITLERTSPYNAIGGEPIILFHDVVERNGARGGTLLFDTSDLLQRYEVSILLDGRVEASNAVPMFTTGAVLRLQLAEIDGELVCGSDVPVRFTGSSMRTLPGLASVALMTFGSAGCAQLFLQRRIALDPSGCEITLTDLQNEALVQTVRSGGSVQLEPGRDYRLEIELDFFNLDMEDKDKVDKLVDQNDKVRLADLGRVIKQPFGLKVAVGREITLVSQIASARAASDGTVSIGLAGEAIHVEYAVPDVVDLGEEAVPIDEQLEPVVSDAEVSS